MDQDQIAIHRLVRFPARYMEGGVSLYDLIEQCNLREQYELGTITASAVMSHLRADNSLIDLWLLWSEDKRHTGGGFFYQDSDGSYLVSPNLDTRPRRYESGVEACAAFILREVESWLK